MTEQHQLLPLGIGERLAQARERRGLSRASIANALRVPLDIVEAIEAGELERFAPVYRRGYVKSYARHLGLPKDEIEELLTGITEEDPSVHSLFPGGVRTGRSDQWLKAMSYVLASLLVGTLAWQFTHEAVRLTQGEVRSADDPQDGQGAAVSAAAQQELADGAQHVNASIAALKRIRARGTAASPSPAEQAWAAMQVESRDSVTEPELAANEHWLNIRTSGDSWVEITDARDEQLELDLLRGGSDKQYRGVAPFRILIGMASAVELYLDGQPVDTQPFTNQGVTQMTLDAPRQDGGHDSDG